MGPVDATIARLSRALSRASLKLAGSSTELLGNSQDILLANRTLEYDQPIPMGIEPLRMVTSLVPVGSFGAHGNEVPSLPNLSDPEKIKICP
jgi:hypothetical protein